MKNDIWPVIIFAVPDIVVHDPITSDGTGRTLLSLVHRRRAFAPA